MPADPAHRDDAETASQRVTRPRLRVLLGVAVVACAVAGAVVLTRDPGATRVGIRPTVLGIPGTAEEVLPAAVTEFLSNASEPGFAPADRRKARRVLANQPGWLIPASDGELCLVRVTYPISDAGGRDLSPAVSDQCEPTEAVQAGKLVEVQTLGASAAAAPMRLVVGIAPEGVSVVKIEAKNGSVASVPVNQNAYEATVRMPTRVLFTRTIGLRTVQGSVTLPKIGGAGGSPRQAPTTPQF
jgi:hypothetical protein